MRSVFLLFVFSCLLSFTSRPRCCHSLCARHRCHVSCLLGTVPGSTDAGPGVEAITLLYVRPDAERSSNRSELRSSSRKCGRGLGPLHCCPSVKWRAGDMRARCEMFQSWLLLPVLLRHDTSPPGAHGRPGAAPAAPWMASK